MSDGTPKTDGARGDERRRWWRRVPPRLFGGRVRTSTVALVVAFLAVLELYLMVRPAPVVQRPPVNGTARYVPVVPVPTTVEPAPTTTESAPTTTEPTATTSPTETPSATTEPSPTTTPAPPPLFRLPQLFPAPPEPTPAPQQTPSVAPTTPATPG
ncbi:hypothetical protein [Speluncibacter jeojiensis]|uniref:Uncharacterized protein n=1 Tax=Speluncibacter jeojiensis TaxID=2710754 RepID=A0A9X4RBT5_9ACTN|nr:hypothetical protein [Corynebacteriales bacterium D3-21]